MLHVENGGLSTNTPSSHAKGYGLEYPNSIQPDLSLAKMLEDHWTPVVANMVRMAQWDTREAVQAARFLAQEKKKLQQKGNGQEAEGPSVAGRLLEQFKTSRKLAACRNIVTEEVELSPGEGEAGVVVEG